MPRRIGARRMVTCAAVGGADSSRSSRVAAASADAAAGDFDGGTPSAAEAATTSRRRVGYVTILDRSNPHYFVASKPPSVVCHHSDWAGSRRQRVRKQSKKDGAGNDDDGEDDDEENEVPMLQRARDALGGRRVNLVHRLDRGASGCLLMTYAKNDNGDNDSNSNSNGDSEEGGGSRSSSTSVTRLLAEAMASPSARKTYLAVVRGEGIYRGRDFKKEGWFRVDRPIKDERGITNEAATWFRFVAGQDNGGGTLDRPRASIVLARPETGRWHQVRRHLNGLSHPILGDSSHGDSRVNREWKRDRGLKPERTLLHLSRLKLGPVPEIGCTDGVDVSCPLAPDMLNLLREHLPAVLEEAEPVLREEGIVLEEDEENTATERLPYEIRDDREDASSSSSGSS